MKTVQRSLLKMVGNVVRKVNSMPEGPRKVEVVNSINELANDLSALNATLSNQIKE